MFIRVHQARFNLNIWGGILGYNLLGPAIILDRLNGAAYLKFFQNTLPLLLEEITLAIRREMWFQHDGAPAHFRLQVPVHLNSLQGEMDREGEPVVYLERSPDLTSLDFSFGDM